MKSTITLLVVCLSAALVRAQTLTVVDPAGETVVEVVTVVGPLGLPTTRTISTLTDTSTSTSTGTSTSTSTSTSSTTTINQGPVGQPAATTATGQTTYTYTTTDAAGNTEVLTAVFTPSSIATTITPSETLTGTILNYSDYTAMVGTNTANSETISSALRTFWLPSRKAFAAGAAALLSGALGGAWLVLP